MFLRILTILFPLFAITAVGYWVGRRMQPDLREMNRITMDVFVPALVFAALANKSFNVTEYLPLALVTLALVVIAGGVGWGLARLSGIAVKTLVPPMMFNNCGNLGLPLAVLAFGEYALAPAVVMFMVSNFLHFTLGAWLLDNRVRLVTVWKVPSVLATCLGVAMAIIGVEIWAPLMLAIKMLGDIAIPIMLFALGVRLAESRITDFGPGLMVATVRPIVGMATAWLVLQCYPLPPLQEALVLIFGALPPAVLNFIFAERYGQEPGRVASMVLLGNVFALLFLSVALAWVLP